MEAAVVFLEMAVAFGFPASVFFAGAVLVADLRGAAFFAAALVRAVPLGLDAALEVAVVRGAG